MPKIEARRVAAFLRDPGAARLVLLYGDDPGLVPPEEVDDVVLRPDRLGDRIVGEEARGGTGGKCARPDAEHRAAGDPRPVGHQPTTLSVSCDSGSESALTASESSLTSSLLSSV